MQRYGDELQHEQEVLTLAGRHPDRRLRGRERRAAGAARAAARRPTPALHAAAATVVINEAAGRIELAARCALAAMADGDTLRTQLAALRRLLKVTPVNLVALRRAARRRRRGQGRLSVRLSAVGRGERDRHAPAACGTLKTWSACTAWRVVRSARSR